MFAITKRQCSRRRELVRMLVVWAILLAIPDAARASSSTPAQPAMAPPEESIEQQPVATTEPQSDAKSKSEKNRKKKSKAGTNDGAERKPSKHPGVTVGRSLTL